MKCLGPSSRLIWAIVYVLALAAVQPCMALVVSEVMYHPPDGDLEFIELYNNRAVFEDLGGCAFTNGIRYTFPPGTVLGAKQYLVVAQDPTALQQAYGISGAYGPYSGKLDNGGERVELSNEAGGIMISFRYNDRAPWPVSADGAGHSLIRRKIAGDPEESASWGPSIFIGGTPGGPDETLGQSDDPKLVTLVDVGDIGRVFKGTEEPSPGAGGVATTDWTEIGFNDDPATTAWIQGPSGYGYSNEGDELQWIGTQLNDMRNGYISLYARLPFQLTAKQISSFSLLSAEVHYDDAFVLYLNGVRVGDSGTMPGEPPTYNQGAGAGADPPPVSVDLTEHIGRLVAGTNILAIQAHNSFQTSSDCLGSPILRASVEPTSTGIDPDARLLINEVLSNSDAAPGVDWVELYNPGSVPVDLGIIYFSDDADDLLKFKLPTAIILQPGEYYSFRQGTEPDGFEFGLDFSGESIFLTAAMGNPATEPILVMDAVNYDVAEPDITLGRYPDGADGFGILTAPTFSSANARPLVHDMVINEIMYQHATRDERYEYVELHNHSNRNIPLAGWTFTDGITYEFPPGAQIAPGSYIVVAKDPDLLADVYGNLTVGANLVGPYTGNLGDHSDRIRLSYPIQQLDPDTGQMATYLVTADEVTYYDGGRWPSWADGQGASLELRDPLSNNNAPDAWADSDESSKSTWQSFSFTITSGGYSQYTHDYASVFDMMLLNRSEVMIDDLQLVINGANRLDNGGFEGNIADDWRILGNHVQSFATMEDSHSGSRSLHLIATGHGDPGANRINQSIDSTSTASVTFSGWARWLRGSRFLLLRTTRERSPVQPPRPSHAFELEMPLNLGTPGMQNTAYVSNRGPDILNVQHSPVLPAAGESIVVTALVSDNDAVGPVRLHYRTEGATGFSSTLMTDGGSGDDMVAGDSIFTGTIPGTSSGRMRAFYIEASDGSASTRFPTMLQPSADVPNRTCLVRVGDSLLDTPFATYRVWMSNDVVKTFESRPNLSNELMDCTFVYNDTEVFYNCRIRHRGSPFLRNGSGRSPEPYHRHGFRIDFNPDQKFRSREEINLDGTEGGSRGPLQERASYWFYRKMGRQYSRQEYIRPILNGRTAHNYEDVQKIDGDYIDEWFPNDNDGYIHKIDDYFEYNVEGTSHRNLDEGLKSDAQHPRLKEVYRWGFEKRGHRENDNWQHLLDFAEAINKPSGSTGYEAAVESMVHPAHFAAVLAIRHAVGDWDSYGYDRGKNNYFYYALPEGKWYLLPWDIDFTLGSGRGASSSLFSVSSNEFPEVEQFINYPKYKRLYMQALAQMVSGPWQTSYGASNPTTDFDKFLDDAANALIQDGGDAGRRNSIKRFVRDRRDYILTQIPSIDFEIVTNGGEDFCTSRQTVAILGLAPLSVAGISVNGTEYPVELTESNMFSVDIQIDLGINVLNIHGLGPTGDPISGATDSITVTRVPSVVINGVAPDSICNNGKSQLTINGGGFAPGTSMSVTLNSISDEIGFDAIYVQDNEDFDQIDAATLLLDHPEDGRGDPVYAVHQWLDLSNPFGQGEFIDNEMRFAPPFSRFGSRYAIRFTGYVSAPSPGVRYFGVNSDEGFSLRINGKLVGEWADGRGQATSDVTGNVTGGTMTYDFPSAGLYYLQLDFFENDGAEAIEFFQTDATGGDRKLINVDAELVVFRDQVARIDATDVVVVDANTITCQVDTSGAEPGMWGVVVTPECGDEAMYAPEDGLKIARCGYDFNGDAVINFLDYAIVTEAWGRSCSEPDWCDGLDLDQSGVIDIRDIAIFADDWLQRPTTPGTVANVSKGKSAVQSSTYGGGSASRAVDGNNDGDYLNGSVTHTNDDTNAWWEVDLGLIYEIDSIEIWNRTGADKFVQRLDDFYAFVSDVPFASPNPASTLAQDGVWMHHVTAAPDPSISLPVGRSGRHVRIQLTGTNYLNLAEVRVFGR